MSERLLDINGARLWVAESGSGTPVMLSSGGPGCCDYLEPVAAMIDDRAHVYRWEQRGCGRSSADGPFDLETTLSDLDGLREALVSERWIVAVTRGARSWRLSTRWHIRDRRKRRSLSRAADCRTTDPGARPIGPAGMQVATRRHR